MKQGTTAKTVGWACLLQPTSGGVKEIKVQQVAKMRLKVRV
jgi:hypothetical protein